MARPVKTEPRPVSQYKAAKAVVHLQPGLHLRISRLAHKHNMSLSRFMRIKIGEICRQEEAGT